MKDHLAALKNPKIKTLIIERLNQEKGRAKTLAGSAATIGDEVLFNLPSKIKPVKEYLDSFEKKHPNKSTIAKGIGFIGGGIVPGAVSVKALGKIGKLGKILKGGGLKEAVSVGGVYGASNNALRNISSDNPLSSLGGATIEGALEGAALGGLFSGGGQAVKAVLSKMKPVTQRQEARKAIDEIATKLFSKMDKSDIKRMKDIVANPTESKFVNFNTLIHKGTPRTIAIADALYNMSPKSRKLIDFKKKELVKGQMPHIQETVIKVLGGGERPNPEKFAEIMKERYRGISRPLYEKAYKDGVIELPKRLEGDPDFLKALKKSESRINAVDKGKEGFEPTAIRTLDKTKRYLQDDVASLINRGKLAEGRDAQIATQSLLKVLKEKSPAYKKALETEEKHFKISAAGKAGRQFHKITEDKTNEILGKMSDHEKYAFQHGALAHLLENAEARANRTEFGELSSEITNPSINPLLAQILGKAKNAKLERNMNMNKDAVQNFKELTSGSLTSKHEANKGILYNAYGALKGNPRSLASLTDKILNKIKGRNIDNEAKTQLKLLLDPKRLLKYENSKIKPRGAGHPALVGTTLQISNGGAK
jgi:hypothetical protein